MADIQGIRRLVGILDILPAEAVDQQHVVAEGNAVLGPEKTMMRLAVVLVAVAMNKDLMAVMGCVVVIEKEVSIWHFVALLGLELELGHNLDL